MSDKVLLEAQLPNDSPVPVNGQPSDLRERFRALADEWKRKSFSMTNEKQMALLNSYQSIIGMGRPAIPLILEEMQGEPAPWFWALEAIVGECPEEANSAADLQARTNAWVEWGERNLREICSPRTPEVLKESFERLASQWKKESHYMSNNVQIAGLRSYQRIIGMGWPAVPLILEELKVSPKQWFWALKAITGENPVGPDIAGRTTMAARAWVDWGIAKGLIQA